MAKSKTIQSQTKDIVVSENLNIDQTNDQDKKSKESVSYRLASFVTSVELLVLLNVIALLVILYFLYAGPPYLKRYDVAGQVVSEVAKLKSEDLNRNEISLSSVISADYLKSQSVLFNDAQDGDIILTFSTGRMIIYRRSTKAIIYDGDNPDVVEQKTIDAVGTTIKSKAIEKGILKITQVSDVSPQMSLLTEENISNTSEKMSDFYKLAQAGDVMAYFPKDSMVVLYRMSTGEIVTSSPYSVSVSEINFTE